MFTYLKNLVLGILLALGNFFPGAKVQTTAIITGLYDDILEFLFQITEIIKLFGQFIVGKSKKEDITKKIQVVNWSFGIPIFAGILVTIIVTSQFASALEMRFPSQVIALSFGIILASIAFPLREMTSKSWREGMLILASFAAFYGLFSLIPLDGSTEPSIWLFVFGGILASLTFLLPGLNTTRLLALAGLNGTLGNSIQNITSQRTDLYSFLVVLLYAIGLAVGMFAFVRFLSFAITKYKSLFLAFVIGLMAASLRATWPFTANNGSVLVWPWQLPLQLFTQQLIFITIAIVLVSLVRKLTENKGTLSTSFGEKQRTIINS